MNAELESLARRAVACKGWRWMPGMLAGPPGERPARVTTPDVGAIMAHNDGWWDATEWMGPSFPADAMLPDLTDPATLGCLLALVREAWTLPDLHTVPHDDEATLWTIEHAGGPVTMPMTTEAAALVAALEAAPCYSS